MLSFVSSINLGKIINILLEPSVTLTLGIFTLLISRNSNLSTVARERLDKVYHPLFLEIEPFLYKKVSLDDISPFLSNSQYLERNTMNQKIHTLFLLTPFYVKRFVGLKNHLLCRRINMAIINGFEFVTKFQKHMTNYVSKPIFLSAAFLIESTTNNIIQKSAWYSLVYGLNYQQLPFSV